MLHLGMAAARLFTISDVQSLSVGSSSGIAASATAPTALAVTLTPVATTVTAASATAITEHPETERMTSPSRKARLANVSVYCSQ